MGVSRGHLDPGYLADYVAAVHAIRRVNRHVRVYASRKSVNRRPEFDGSLRVGGQLAPWKLGRLAAEYVRWMRRHGIPISMMSLDNEPALNDGRLTPVRFGRAAAAMARRLGSQLPRLAMNDGNNPDPQWMWQAPGWVTDRLTYGTTHANPSRRLRQGPGLAAMARASRGRGLSAWNTEFHWLTGWSGTKVSMFSLFDQTDAGYTGFVWWAYHPPSWSARGRLMSRISSTLDNARPVATSDWDGRAAIAGRVSARAYRRGHSLYLWLVNDTDRAFFGKRVVVEGARTRPVRPVMERWTKGPGGDLTWLRGHGSLRHGRPVVSIPPRSVSLVRLERVIR